MRSCVRLVRLIQSWLLRKRARSQRSSFDSPSVAYDSPEHCQSTKHGSTSNRTTSQKIKVRVYPITCPLCKGLVTNERMGVTADVRVRNMGTISCRPRTFRRGTFVQNLRILRGCTYKIVLACSYGASRALDGTTSTENPNYGGGRDFPVVRFKLRRRKP